MLGKDFAREYPHSVEKFAELGQLVDNLELSRIEDTYNQLKDVRLTEQLNRCGPKQTYQTLRPSVNNVEPTKHNKSSLSKWSKPKKTSQQAAVDFMRGIMDEFTHLGNFTLPFDTSLIEIVAAKSDAYILRDSVLSLEELWPGARVRYIDTGHVQAFISRTHVFRSVCGVFSSPKLYFVSS